MAEATKAGISVHAHRQADVFSGGNAKENKTNDTNHKHGGGFPGDELGKRLHWKMVNLPIERYHHLRRKWVRHCATRNRQQEKPSHMLPADPIHVSLGALQGLKVTGSFAVHHIDAECASLLHIAAAHCIYPGAGICASTTKKGVTSASNARRKCLSVLNVIHL
ncbi:GTPase ObgE [Anopheles sinensis]|uniref:GTPase ObgE n=1 Tax=Anopheles sinensis TaxID=74873 RepID=A0A084W272_ANOSI|nr:GTPase ObgE [Anopheles sinensis]